MTRLRSCAKCGRTHGITERCPRVRLANRPGGWSGRNTTEHNRWAAKVKDRDGWRCTFILESGERCAHTSSLQAHHLYPGYAVEDGVTLCREHHRVLDPHAR